MWSVWVQFLVPHIKVCTQEYEYKALSKALSLTGVPPITRKKKSTAPISFLQMIRLIRKIHVKFRI